MDLLIMKLGFSERMSHGKCKHGTGACLYGIVRIAVCIILNIEFSSTSFTFLDLFDKL